MFSTSFADNIYSLGAGFLSGDRVAAFQTVLEENSSGIIITAETEANLLRMLHSFFDPKLFIRDCLSYPFYARVLMLVAGHSNYLTDIVVRDPGPFFGMLTEGRLHRKTTAAELKKTVQSGISSFGSFEKKVAFLKNVKRRQTLKIALRDMLGYAELNETVEILSLLATLISKHIFQLCFLQAAEKLGAAETKPDYTIIALGKLGGGELNYSSDIDLMVFYRKNKRTAGGAEYYEILTEAIRKFSAQMSHPDENGFLYRVDFRLRPDGKAAPLCRTLNDTLRYYESRGEHWERQMLIKAGFIAGSKKLFNEFISYISHYIYPGSAFTSPLDQIRRLRKNILKSNKSDFNIKLSSGGIRDIEFGIQALQLIYGGKNPGIRSGNTLSAIALLHEANFLTDAEKNRLTDAYIFYRKIEHYLQGMNDTQTHTIPESGEISDKLAAYFGFKAFSDFLAAVRSHKVLVKKFYGSVMLEEGEGHSPQEDFEMIPFADRETARKNYNYLKDGKGLSGTKQFDRISIRAFDRIEANLLSTLFTAPDPDLLLANITRILNKVTLPSVWYEQLNTKPFFDAFIALCSTNRLGFEYLISNSLLQERFLSGRIFERSDFSTSMSVEEIYLSCSMKVVLGVIPPENLNKTLSALIREKIHSFFERKGESFPAGQVCVVAAGSIAAQTMSFSSDVDLIFIAEDGYNPPDLQQSFFQLLAELKQYMHPLDIDIRLRPEGTSSEIVFTVSTYKKYIAGRARVWEFQAMTKMIPVYGNALLLKRIRRAAASQISALPAEFLSSEISAMRKKLVLSSAGGSPLQKIKKGQGGYQDLEFIVQFLILRESAYLSHTGVTEFSSVLKQLRRKKFIWEKDYSIINENYTFLKTLEVFLQITLPPSGNFKQFNINMFIHAVSKHSNTVNVIMEKLEKIYTANAKLFNRVLGGQL